jgi:hypothetical protein
MICRSADIGVFADETKGRFPQLGLSVTATCAVTGLPATSLDQYDKNPIARHIEMLRGQSVRECAKERWNKYEATVLNDNTVRIQGKVIDIPPGPGGRGYAKKRVEVVQRLDGSWWVYWKDMVIAKAGATEVDELRARRRHKHSGATRAFRKAITRIAASLP